MRGEETGTLAPAGPERVEEVLPLHAVVDRLGSLGDPTRVRILLALGQGELAVGELCQALQLPQSTVSRHLRTLAESSWVSARSEGTSRVYRRVPEADLPAPALWAAVKGPAEATPEAREDGERAEAVLLERRERSRRFFRSAAGRWDSLRRELFGDVVERSAPLGLIEPDWSVGDLGCGTGAFTAQLASAAGRVVGVDREPEMLEAARERLEGMETVDLREGELERLPMEDGELDLAFLLLVLHLLPDPRAALREAGRVLRPGGRLIIVDMRSHSREEYRQEMGHLWSGFEAETVARWLEEAGFEGIHTVPLTPEPDASGPLLFRARGRKKM